ncbi:MAG TPA: response regulator [Oligoflexia bacterium]|nr:response regulator [Oligoflexia bacterium]
MRLKPTVLIIEDDEGFRKIMELVLARFGVNTKAVADPEEFLKAADSLNPNLYLIDLNLDGSSGFDLIKTLRERKKLTGSIVVVSGSKESEAISHALELGANDYILKPLDRVLLATKLSQFIQTDEIKEHSAKQTEPTDGRVEVRLSFDGQITSVDEIGIEFTSATLSPKGTVLKLNSDFFKLAGLPVTECLVTVASTWLVPDTGRYGAYAEFDGVSAEFQQALRNWLSRP